ncbi:hypothetical protein BO70DRAFT_426318 [Aspergillus heteromorphus CBS 117.55]|uniref:Uncharacterized protein n=1 Tax=Aspergillus heteromorphus CBS 117.55 TaxID=1448321 RepID=A0A317WXF7_9EURO|nr:uncharacterized protein BO70DRAFT_426318 [Aspergillus heteromorphus CBS 117.55]PWY89897.1 hypothetical protein BO70DRAFT_426318 [Aspergillus heteromorphus CBS 117.55]
MIPYPMIGPESYGLKRSAQRSTRSLASTHIDDDSKSLDSHEHVETFSETSNSRSLGWRAKLSQKYKMFHFP